MGYAAVQAALNNATDGGIGIAPSAGSGMVPAAVLRNTAEAGGGARIQKTIGQHTATLSVLGSVVRPAPRGCAGPAACPGA